MSDSNSKTAKQRLREAFLDGIPVPPPGSDAPDYSPGLMALAMAIDDNQDAIDTLQGRLVDHAEDLQALRNRDETLADRIDDLEEHVGVAGILGEQSVAEILAAHEQNLTRLEEDKAAGRAANVAAEARNGVESNGRAIGDLEGRLERVDARSLRTKNVAEDLKTRLEKVDGWIEALADRIDTLEGKVQDRGPVLSRLRKDLDARSAWLNEVDYRLDDLEGELLQRVTNGMFEELEGRVETLEARTRRVANTATANREASEEAHTKADDTDEVLGEVLGRLDELKGRFDRLEVRVETLLDIVAR